MKRSLWVTHISPSEWRWVFAVAGVLAVLTLVPYAWALAANASSSEWHFMGILANPQDGASYLAKIGQGMRGEWLVHFQHTPDEHVGAAIQVFYLLLGHLARIIGVSNLVIFHLARVITTLFMYSAIYQFSAIVWTRLRPRRLFFALISVGSGLGWLAILLDPNLKGVPDITVPEAYPLYATYTNPHFPLTLGCLALLAGLYISVFRIDFGELPTVANGGLGIFLLTLVVAFIFPQALIPLGGALVVYIAAIMIRERAIPVLQLRWVSMFMLPAALMAGFYLAVLANNPVMSAVWNGQVSATAASPILVLLGFGLLLLVALPGLVRAVRSFEEDGDQLMLIWLVVNFVLVFLPFNQQRRLMTGLIIPVVFFAVRSIEDYWIDRVPSRARLISVVLLVAFVMPSNVLAIGVPIFGLLNPEAGLEQKLLVQHGYREAMNWLAAEGEPNSVVLSSPNVGLWIPASTSDRVVYGHPWETLHAESRLAYVTDWYSGKNCDLSAQDGGRYAVLYVIVGPQEQAFDSDTCYASLAEVSSRKLQFEDVALFELAN